MLVNILYPESNSDPEIFNRIIPGCTLTRLLRAYNAPKPRIFSTHSIYRRNIRRTVYLIRDGRNSVSSLFRYTTIRAGLDMGFNQWFAYYMKGMYGPRWDQNVVSWLISGREYLKENILLVRYEDLCTDAIPQLEKVCTFLGINYTQDDLARAIEASSIQKMRKWERKYVGELKDINASFYRGKQTNEWESLVDEEQKKHFLSVSDKALRLGGYI